VAAASDRGAVGSDFAPASAPPRIARETLLQDNGASMRAAPPEGLVERWVRRGDELLRRLGEHGAEAHEYRADLREGRFVWLGPDGRVSVEARAHVLCSWSRSTCVLVMAWADPLLRGSGAPRLDTMAPERDDVGEEEAWQIAMQAAESVGAEYLYRVPTPHAWYFLALRELTFNPRVASFHPGSPVGLVLRSLTETRGAIESRAEPSTVIRDRLEGVGSAFLHHAGYAYRSTDWVARLERTGRRLLHLAQSLPRPSYGSVAAGHAEEWLDRDMAVFLLQSLSLLEDEWGQFV
jgi:hypothetical protein